MVGGMSPPLLWLGGFPYENRLQKKVGTLILTSLLEDLVLVSQGHFGLDGKGSGALYLTLSQYFGTAKMGGVPLISL